jgi:hypothetical protein
MKVIKSHEYKGGGIIQLVEDGASFFVAKKIPRKQINFFRVVTTIEAATALYEVNL